MSFSSSSCYSEMFPSTNDGNVDPINYHCPFFTEFTSSNQHLPFDQSNFFNFPSSCFTPCYDDFFRSQNGEFLAHKEQQPLKEFEENLMVLDMAVSEDKKEEGKTVIRKNKCSSKRDRHSKINTAQGPRDRRMRLSLKVARDFFDLQDKLRFDKASKTVEWLLLQARSAIKLKSRISTIHDQRCECEIISRMVEEDEAAAIKDTSPKALACSSVQKKGKKEKPSRKTAFRPDAKELRKKARAKARERTLEKQRRNKQEEEEEEEAAAAANHINHFSCSSETAEDSVTQTHSLNPLVADATSQLAAHDSLAAIGKWSPFPSLTHLYNPEFPQQNEITDFQTILWE